MFRLHIDIPVGDDQQAAIAAAKILVGVFTKEIEKATGYDECKAIREFGYRLLSDSDRGSANYLDINENGHARNKKLKVYITLP